MELETLNEELSQKTNTIADKEASISTLEFSIQEKTELVAKQEIKISELQSEVDLLKKNLGTVILIYSVEGLLSLVLVNYISVQPCFI